MRSQNLYDSLCCVPNDSTLPDSEFQMIVLPEVISLAGRYKRTLEVSVAKTLDAANKYLSAAKTLQELFSSSDLTDSVVSWLNCGFESSGIASAILDQSSCSPAQTFLTEAKPYIDALTLLLHASSCELQQSNCSGRSRHTRREAFLMELALLLHRNGCAISSYDKRTFAQIGAYCIQEIEEQDDVPDISNSLKQAVKFFKRNLVRH